MVSKAVVVVGAALAGAVAVCPACSDGSERADSRGPASTVAAVAHAVQSADTATVTLAIRGMTCGACATTARIALERVDGVHRAVVSADSARAVVDFDPAKTSPPRFIANLEKQTGFEAEVVPTPSDTRASAAEAEVLEGSHS